MVSAPDFSESHLGRALTQAGSEAIVACDQSGVIRYWNAGAERMFGHAAAEVLGRSLDVIIPERLRERHWQAFHTTMRTGQSRYAQGALLAVPGLRRDGSQISIEFTITPLFNERHEIEALIAVIRDVTKRFGEIKALREEIATLRKQKPG